MTAHQRLYRTIGLVVIFFFLQGQSCEPLLLEIFGFDNPDEVDCSEVQITSFTQDANGNVSMTWNGLGEEYEINVSYQDTLIASYYVRYPSTILEFQIDWASLQGSSNSVEIELIVDSFYTSGDCRLYRTLERPNTVANSMNCANLRLTSPLAGMANGLQTFYWDALDGAVNYRINIYENNESPAPLIGLDAGNVTNLTMDVSVAAIGGETPLVVELLANDSLGNACTQRYEIAREAAAPQSAPSTATPTCAQDPSASYC